MIRYLLSKHWPLFLTVAIVGGLLYACQARAAGTSVTLNWVHPVQNTDNSALALADIKETLITWRRPNQSAIVGTVRVTAPATTVTVPNLTCGAFEFTATTVVKANNMTSDETAKVPYQTGVVCKPNPPSAVTAQ